MAGKHTKHGSYGSITVAQKQQCHTFESAWLEFVDMRSDVAIGLEVYQHIIDVTAQAHHSWANTSKHLDFQPVSGSNVWHEKKYRAGFQPPKKLPQIINMLREIKTML